MGEEDEIGVSLDMKKGLKIKVGKNIIDKGIETVMGAVNPKLPPPSDDKILDTEKGSNGVHRLMPNPNADKRKKKEQVSEEDFSNIGEEEKE